MKFFPKHPLEAHIRDTTIDICRTYSFRTERTLGEKVASAAQMAVAFFKSWQGLMLIAVLGAGVMVIGQHNQREKNETLDAQYRPISAESTYQCAANGKVYHTYSDYMAYCPAK